MLSPPEPAKKSEPPVQAKMSPEDLAEVVEKLQKLGIVGDGTKVLLTMPLR